MKEIDFLRIISNTLQNNKYLGDDCAYLEDLDIYITQDTLVEDVHFTMNTISAYELGIKSIAVNLSDLASCAALPKYLTISLSLPKTINNNFIKEFYNGVNTMCQQYKTKVVGGDLTKSEKIIISICAIGKKIAKYKAARQLARPNDVIITTGPHGESAAGLKLLPQKTPFTSKHLTPEPRVEHGIKLGQICTRDFAMMDTSDGLADALYKIATESKVKLSVDFSKIPFNPKLKEYFSIDYKKLILWGGEDYELVACIKESDYNRLDKNKFFKIGTVTEKSGTGFVMIKDKKNEYTINEKTFDENSYKHFEE